MLKTRYFKGKRFTAITPTSGSNLPSIKIGQQGKRYIPPTDPPVADSGLPKITINQQIVKNIIVPSTSLELPKITIYQTAKRDGGSAIAADPYPRLLLNFDNNLTDSSLWSRTVTNNGNCGFSTTAKFGTHSLSLPSSSAYLSLPSSGSFNLADSDFTIEFFIRFNSVPSVDSAAYFFYKDGVSSNRESAAYYSLFSGTHRLIFLYTDSGGLKQAISNISAPVANTWYHYCWERKNGTLKNFIDGVKQGSNHTVNTIIPTNQQITIGNRTPNASSFFNFLADEMRVTVEKAIYNGADSFTPPSNPF